MSDNDRATDGEPALPASLGVPASLQQAAQPASLAVMTPWREWDTKLAFAGHLISTGFCPREVRTPAQALAIIMTGQELGIPPMRALRQIAVINGKPTISAELMLAKMLHAGVRINWDESSDTRATLTAERHMTKFTGSFSIDEATRAGLTTKDGWRKYPAAMLRARVISLVARVVAPDLIGGLYTPEEMGLDMDGDGNPLGPIPGNGAGPIPVAAPLPGAWANQFGAVTTLDQLTTLWAQCQDAFMGWAVPDQQRVAAAYETARQRLSITAIVAEVVEAEGPGQE